MIQDRTISDKTKAYAVITGATSGLGLAYAKWKGLI